MNRCETCKHWGNLQEWSFQMYHKGPGDQRQCGRIPDMAETGDDELALECAYTKDGEGFCSAIMTKGDFGCVLWEAKK